MLNIVIIRFANCAVEVKWNNTPPPPNSPSVSPQKLVHLIIELLPLIINDIHKLIPT